MNVRMHLFLQKLHRVRSSRVTRYSIRCTLSRPTNVVRLPCSRVSRCASSAQPIAPLSPQCGCTMMRGSMPVPLNRVRMKSTCALTAARLCCVPPCSTNVCPSFARFGICATYSQMFFGSTAASPAMISGACQPFRWKSTMSVCRNTAQPYPNSGIDSAANAASAYCSTS